MKYIRQLLIILSITFLGEILKYALPFPVPASIYGLVLLFLALELHIIPLESVKDTGKFLVEIMPLMFIPAGVGLIDSWGALRPVFLPVAVITVISTVLVMVVSGRVTQSVMHWKRKGTEREDNE
jgi:holin-like protein